MLHATAAEDRTRPGPGYSGTRPDKVPHMSGKNRNLRLELEAHQNWLIEDWRKTQWVDDISISAATFRW